MDKPIIIKLQDLMTDNISYDVPIKIKNKIHVPFSLKTNNRKSPLFIQMTNMYYNDPLTTEQLTLPLLCRTDEQTKMTIEKLSKLDVYIQTNLKHILQGIKRLHPRDSLPKKFIYNSLIHNVQAEKDNIYSNGILKIPFDSHDRVKIYNNKREPLSIQDCKYYTGSYISSIIEIRGLVIDGENISIDVKCHQCKITEQELKVYELDEYSFIDSDDENSAISDNNVKEVKDNIDDIDNNILDKLNEIASSDSEYEREKSENLV